MALHMAGKRIPVAFSSTGPRNNTSPPVFILLNAAQFVVFTFQVVYEYVVAAPAPKRSVSCNALFWEACDALLVALLVADWMDLLVNAGASLERRFA